MSIYKAYDIRGIYPSELNEEEARKIAQAYAKITGVKKVALGRDTRFSGEPLLRAVSRGLTDHGVDVVDLGVITTDMLYFASSALEVDGGIMVSASHNPNEYNGLKLMKQGGVAVSRDSGIKEIEKLVRDGYEFKSDIAGKVSSLDVAEKYLSKCREFISGIEIRHFNVVVNGMSGSVVKNLEKLNLPINMTRLNDKPDGSFPGGCPDPTLEGNKKETSDLILSSGADFGVAWDGDADRFFLFDEKGRWIPGYFLTAFLGSHFATTYPGAKIIHDTSLSWAVEEAVSVEGGTPLANRSGHSYIKERMRSEDAVFGGETSGHFYFRDFYYADSGLVAFLVMLGVISRSGKKVSELFQPFFSKYFISGEINKKLTSEDSAGKILSDLELHYAGSAEISHPDGLVVEGADWRASVRISNTEPLLRLNIEARSEDVLKKKTVEFGEIIAAAKFV